MLSSPSGRLRCCQQCSDPRSPEFEGGEVPLKTMDGWQVFEANDKLPALPAGLADQLSAASRFGFKVSQVDGKPVWEAVTEQDYRNAQARRLGVKPEDVTPDCDSAGPRSCEGSCTTPASCRLVYDRASGIYYCRRN